MKKSQTAQNLEAVAQDLLAINIKPTYPYNYLMQKFYTVMRKHGIKQGTWCKNGIGRQCDSAEWSICSVFFHKLIDDSKIFQQITSKVPQDLMAYGKQPKLKTKLGPEIGPKK